ncbi:DinB superfamily protein [Paenibacillus algorifonticola]|uniref:Putative metal-dependent hydrolase SAMN04487969_101626 n=1 Tax=Paenibacillus algorifonticola TaxID=684063 RepID=A0A1I1YLY5_9BACL|nr:bacillithiol transferase BstA [Paenibacillus algorifonticola]SFE20409.1 DinB superfamily protein [Paenibacillus algorifonticola]
MDVLRFPIGLFEHEGDISRQQLDGWFADIESAPARLRAAVSDLSAEQLDTPYRPDGWTVRQVVHHIADSHMNAYMRYKLALTEETPTIRPYYEERWAELSDGRTGPVELSLALLDALHSRWLLLLRSLSREQLERAFIHPESGNTIRLNWNAGNYAWHGNHHIAHITRLRERMGWTMI